MSHLSLSGSILAGLALCWALAACGEEGGAATNDDDASASSSGESSSGDGADDDDDASPGPVGDGGPTRESGPPPTEVCPHQADENGFFILTSPASDYAVRLPAGYATGGTQPYRLFVALKGCGDNASNFATWAAAPYDVRSAQDYIAISVGGRDGTCWESPEDEALVTAAIEHVRGCFPVNEKQIVIGGYDSGGQLALAMGLANANRYAGILVEHATLSSAVGPSKVDAVLAAAEWKLPIAFRAGTADEFYPIATMRSDVAKLEAAGFPVDLFETDNEHGGETEDWVALLAKMATWNAP